MDSIAVLHSSNIAASRREWHKRGPYYIDISQGKIISALRSKSSLCLCQSLSVQYILGWRSLPLVLLFKLSLYLNLLVQEELPPMIELGGALIMIELREIQLTLLHPLEQGDNTLLIQFQFTDKPKSLKSIKWYCVIN